MCYCVISNMFASCSCIIPLVNFIISNFFLILILKLWPCQSWKCFKTFINKFLKISFNQKSLLVLENYIYIFFLNRQNCSCTFTCVNGWWHMSHLQMFLHTLFRLLDELHIIYSTESRGCCTVIHVVYVYMSVENNNLHTFINIFLVFLCFI